MSKKEVYMKKAIMFLAVAVVTVSAFELKLIPNTNTKTVDGQKAIQKPNGEIVWVWAN